MKNIIILLLSINIITISSCNNIVSKTKETIQKFPQPIGYVNDFEDLLSDKEEKELENIISLYEIKTTNEIAIVTIKSISNYSDFDKYALDLSNNWGVGKKDKDNGLTIIISKKLRKIKINTGTQTEKILTNEICEKILNEKIIPNFKDDNYYIGVKKSLEEFILNW